MSNWADGQMSPTVTHPQRNKNKRQVFYKTCNCFPQIDRKVSLLEKTPKQFTELEEVDLVWCLERATTPLL